MRKYLILAIFLPLFTVSCKKDEVKPVSNTTLNAQARDALNELMTDWYYWFANLPTVTLSDYKDPYELLTALRYKKYDRWSFVADYNAYVKAMQGSFVGHGIRLGLDKDNLVRIVMIYKNSPMYSKGVRRGWIVKKLNNTELAPIFVAQNWESYNQLIGEAKAGITNTFLFQIPDGRDSVITTTKSTFQVNSVTKYDTLNLKSGKTAYLAFDEFIEPSTSELQTAFNFFKAQNATDLILDLRYNGGGILNVAVELASLISGQPVSNALIKFDYNSKHTAENQTSYFKQMTSSLNLSRMVVITTRETASASEVIINGLKPYMNIKLVGDTTDGKPTGMNVWQYQYKFIFAPITFKLVNSQNQGDFFDGFAPDKYVSDDITHDFGSRNENCVKEAIKWFETGSFSSKSGYSYYPLVQVSEKPEWRKNLFTEIREIK
jgi:C-terminal processing protease CtpA/Prc